MGGPPKAFVDLYRLPEDDRIELIVSTAACGHTVAVFVDDEAAAERYVKKFRDRIRVIDRTRGPGNTICIRCAPKEH